jgi:hypothetical protein
MGTLLLSSAALCKASGLDQTNRREQPAVLAWVITQRTVTIGEDIDGPGGITLIYDDLREPRPGTNIDDLPKNYTT